MLTYNDLHNYQRAAEAHILGLSHCALFLDMGLGKTISTLSALEFLLYQELEIDKALVIAPKRVVENVWRQEAAKWQHTQRLKVQLITGTPKQRAEALEANADVYVIGRDLTAWLYEHYKRGRFPFEMLVIDELSSFKNPRSQRFKALKKLRPLFKRIVGLTGTPAPNGLIDLWSQLYLLDAGERLEPTLGAYRAKYFDVGARNGALVYTYVLKEGSESLIHGRIGDICMSMKAEDYLELPGRTDNIIRLELPAKVKKDYLEFEKEQILKIVDPEATITAANAAALSNKLLQYANGAIYDEDRKVSEIHSVKLEAIKEIVEDYAPKPMLIAYAYQHDRDRLKKALAKYEPRELKSSKDVEDWNKGKIKVLLMHPASGGHGLNLQSGGHLITWYGLTWSLELWEQFNARLDRQGQQNKVIINIIVASGTMDEKVLNALSGKSNTQNALMAAVKARIDEYIKTH